MLVRGDTKQSPANQAIFLQINKRDLFDKIFGRTHGAPYRGYGYVPLRFGRNVVRRMGTQQIRHNKEQSP